MATPEEIARANAHTELQRQQTLDRLEQMYDVGVPKRQFIDNDKLFDYLKSLEARIARLEAKETLL